MHPDIKTGQGTSQQSVWLDGNFWHEPHMPPSDTRTIRVWLRGENGYRLGYCYAPYWIVNDNDGLATHVEAAEVIGWQNLPPQAEPQPAPPRDWPLMLFVAVLVLGVTYVGWHDAGLGAAMLGGVAFGSVLGYAATRKENPPK